MSKHKTLQKLGDYIFEQKTRVGQRKPMVLSVTNNDGFVKQDTYFSKKVHSKNISNYKLVKQGDFAYNPSRINVGSIARLENFEEGALSPMYVVFSVDNSRLLPEYLEFYTQTHDFATQIKHNTAGSVRNSLSFDSLSNFNINVPDLVTQKEIIKYLNLVEETLLSSKKSAELLKILKKGLSFHLFSSGTRTYKPSTDIHGDLPDGWIVEKIEDSSINLIDGDRGSNYPKQKDFIEGGYCLFLSTPNIKSGRFDFSSSQFINEEKDRLLRKGKLRRGDIVLTTRGTVGKLAIYDESVEFDHIRINSGMLIIRPGEDYDTTFLLQQLLSHSVQQKMQSIASGSAQPQLPIRSLNELQIVKPPISEQKQIAEMLNLVDEKIFLEGKNFSSQEELKVGLMQDLFSGKAVV